MTIKVAINGFGRIGRLVLRIAAERKVPFQIVAINDLVPADNLAYLLKYDSVHKAASFSVESSHDGIIANGNKIQVVSQKDPTQLPWKDLGIDFVVESTGFFTSKEDAEKHIHAGAKRVLISAPAKGDVPTFVMGVNHNSYKASEHHVLSNASCTTNCLAPLSKVLLDNFGIEEGLMTTVHSLTATQPTVDGPSKKDWRGGRSAAINIIPASTGAAKAVSLCLPELKGKLTGMAFRVPTIDVSCVDLTVRLSKDTTYDEIAQAFKTASETSMKGILGYTEDQVVSSDFIGSTYSCVFDKEAGIALNNRFYKLIAWYDNEMGYASRIVDMLSYMVLTENKQ